MSVALVLSIIIILWKYDFSCECQIIVVSNTDCTDFDSRDVCIKMLSNFQPCAWCETANKCVGYDVCTNVTITPDLPNGCYNVSNLVFGQDVPTCFDIENANIQFTMILGYVFCVIVIIILASIIITMFTKTNQLLQDYKTILKFIGFCTLEIIYISFTIYSLVYYKKWINTHSDTDFNKSYIPLFVMTFVPLSLFAWVFIVVGLCMCLYCCFADCLYSFMKWMNTNCCGRGIMKCLKAPFLWFIQKLAMCRSRPDIDFENAFDENNL